MFELSAIIKGNVQGVGFRATAKLIADKLKVTGFVRNLPDGNVELCAQGQKPQLENFLAELKREFSLYIREVVYDFRSVRKIYSDFRILR